MLTIRRLLDRLQRREPEERELLLEYALIVTIMALVVVLSFVLFGDAISDTIALIGGTVDEATVTP